MLKYLIQTSIFCYSKNYSSLTGETRIKDAVNMEDLICLLATVCTLKGTISYCQFQNLTFFQAPRFFCIFRENFIVIAYRYNNSLRNSTFLERKANLCCWELIVPGDNWFKPVFLVRNPLILDFLQFKCIFPFGTVILTFLKI